MEIKYSNQQEIDKIDKKASERISELLIKCRSEKLSQDEVVEVFSNDKQLNAFNHAKAMLYKTSASVSYNMSRDEYLALTGRG